MKLIGLLLFLFAVDASAAALYRCEGPALDQVSIQSVPCPAGSKQIWKRDGTPEPPLTAEQLRAREEKSRQDSRDARALSQLAGTQNSASKAVYQINTKADYAKARCASAKEQAKVIRERDWKILTVDRLRQLDSWVESECR